MPIQRTGKPEYRRLEDNVMSALQQRDTSITAASAFTADSAMWASPAPTTVQEAITRIASAVSGLLGTPIP
jgi:hypothetical protein